MEQEFYYQKIRAYIEDKIQLGCYENGKIEGENELTSLFQVSRATVRQALAELQKDGLIYTLPKKGSFVSSQQKLKELDGLHSFTEDAARLNKQAHTKVVCLKKEAATQDVFDIIKSKEVWHVIRIRYLDAIPAAYEDGYFNADLITELSYDILKASLYDYIESKLLYIVGYAEQEIKAVVCPDISIKLSLHKEAPLLKINQKTYIQGGDCIEYCDTYYRCDVYNFHQNAYRKARG